MKFIVPLLFVTTLFCDSTKAENITYDFLVETGEMTGDCDHIPVFEKILETIKVRTLLEFGLGYSTKYFLDTCSKVISVEFVSTTWETDWIKECLNLYRGSSNWVPVVYFSNFNGDFSWAPYKYHGSDALYRARYFFILTGQSYADFDRSYQNEMQFFLSMLTKYNTIDVAFVDSGMVLRADIVQVLFEKIPVILANDTKPSYLEQNPYGLASLQVPANYEEIRISRGVGTTVWVKKTEELAPLIQALKNGSSEAQPD
ncbi:MAG: hypothetical protein V4492_07335 [Chlamydiota bacterium]